MKACRTCRRSLPSENFCKHPSSADRLQYDCKACTAERMREYRRRHPEKVAERNRHHYEVKGEQCRAQARRWHLVHPGHIAARNRSWRKAHPELRLAEHQRRRAARNGGRGVTGAEWLAILERYGNRCLACGSTENLTMDHVVPLALGGLHDTDNVQPLCKGCNFHKHTKVADYRPAAEERLAA